MKEQDKKAYELMMSPTMSMLVTACQDPVVDVMDKEELHTALCTLVVELCKALDEGKIQCDGIEAKAPLYELLAITLGLISGGKVRGEKITIQTIWSSHHVLAAMIKRN